MAKKKRPKDKPKKTVKAIGAKRTGFIDYITLSGEHCRERITDSCGRPKSGKRHRHSTLKQWGRR